MNTPKLKSLIKEEIISVLKEAEEGLSSDEIESKTDATKDLNKELQKTVDLNKELSLEETEGDDEPTTSQLKGASKDSVSVLATKLQQISSELKSTLNKWKNSDGGEKVKLRDRLMQLTNIKKEIESMLE